MPLQQDISSSRPGRWNQGFRVRNVEREMRREMPVSARGITLLCVIFPRWCLTVRVRSFPGQSGVSETLIRPFARQYLQFYRHSETRIKISFKLPSTLLSTYYYHQIVRLSIAKFLYAYAYAYNIL